MKKNRGNIRRWWVVAAGLALMAASLACTLSLASVNGTPVLVVDLTSSPAPQAEEVAAVLPSSTPVPQPPTETTTPQPPTATAGTPSATEPATPAATATLLADGDLATLDAEDRMISNLYARVSPSVVHVTAQVITVDYFWGAMPSEGTGSGFVLDHEGHIVTNNHVVEGAQSVTVILEDGTQVPAEVIGTDLPNDLAVIKIDVAPERLVPVELGDSSTVQVGHRAIAIGNPFGLDRTLTTGVISALGRPLQIDQETVIYNVIQTDAAINPGNSGGPLLNTRGQVIGVNAAIHNEGEGIGFAVSVDAVKRIVPALISEGYYPHPWLGFLGYPITPKLARQLKLPTDHGILIAHLQTSGPARQAGIRGSTGSLTIDNQQIMVGGDILIAVDEITVYNWDGLLQHLEENTRVGQEINLTILRDSQTLTLTLTLEEQPRF